MKIKLHKLRNEKEDEVTSWTYDTETYDHDWLVTEELDDEFAALKKELRAIRLHKAKEESLREKHPGLQDLWEQYQAMLRLVE